MKNFDSIWKLAAKGEVSPPLKPLIREAYDELVRKPTDIGAVKIKLENLLVYLASPPGLTDANCRATDLFFCLGKEPDEWGHLPRAFKEIVDDIAMQLHDAVAARDIAKNFESLPEQLLDRIRKIKTDGAV